MHVEDPDNPGAGLCISLFGPPSVMWAGKFYPVPRRNVRGLLYYLSIQTRPITREQLTLLFWGDEPEAYARRNLTRLLTHLRRALPAPEVLCVEDDRIYLEESAYWCDARRFQSLTEKGSPAGERFEQAVSLYAGPFLDGFSLPESLDYQNWVHQKRSQYENRFLETLAALVNASTLRQDYPAAIHYATRCLEIDNLAEEMHRRLIALYALSRDPGRALRQYEECVAILERELGVGPLPETRQVYQSVLQGREVRVEDQLESTQPTWFHLLKVDIPLVGRGPALQRLGRALLLAQANQPPFVLVDGEPGIGKSRMLYDFTVRGQHHCLALAANGERSAGKIPYRAIVDALRASPVPVPTGLSPVWVRELARLLPELGQESKPLGVRSYQNRDEDRLRLFEALNRLIFALAGEYGALILAFDDLHWFDQASLQWLSYFSQQVQARSSPVLVIGTYRTEDLERLKDLRDGLLRVHRLEEIHLEGLSAGEISDLLTQTLGRHPGGEQLAQRLKVATGGNPFFLIETLRTLEAEGRLRQDLQHLVDLPIPQGVQEAVNRRLGRLSARARQVLEAGAVLGSSFDFHSVCATAGRTALETSASLDDLTRQTLLLEDEESYRFGHDLVRKAVAAAIHPHRWRMLQVRAGQALEKFQPGAITALADHFDAGGEWEKALHYHALAAQSAKALYAWQEAEGHLYRMLTILDRLDPSLTRSECLCQRGELLESLAHLHALQGHLAERDQTVEQVVHLSETSCDPRLQLLACILQTRYHNQDGRYQEAVDRVGKCLPLATCVGDTPARYRLLAMSGFSYHFLGKPDLELDAFIQARAIEDSSIDLSLRAYVAERLAFSHLRLGDYRKALAYQQEAYDNLVQKGDHNGAIEISIEISFLNANLGRFEEAEESLVAALAHFRKYGLRPDEGHALLAFAELHRLRGDYSVALRLFTEAVELLEPLRTGHITAAAEMGLGYTYYQLGFYDRGRTWVERGLERARSAGQRIGTAEALIQLSLVDLVEAQLESARVHLAEGLQLAGELQSGELLAAGLAAQARLERACGEHTLALEHALAAAEQAHQVEQVNLVMWALTEAGLTLLECGDLPGAGEKLSQAVELASRSVEDWLGTEQVYLANARALHAQGISPAAGDMHRWAQAVLAAKAERITDPDLRQAFLDQFPLASPDLRSL
jgi:DNA-binding SARP family transcriptional activator